jgi:hypothetical protein
MTISKEIQELTDEMKRRGESFEHDTTISLCFGQVEKKLSILNGRIDVCHTILARYTRLFRAYLIWLMIMGLSLVIVIMILIWIK